MTSTSTAAGAAHEDHWDAFQVATAAQGCHRVALYGVVSLMMGPESGGQAPLWLLPGWLPATQGAVRDRLWALSAQGSAAASSGSSGAAAAPHAGSTDPFAASMPRAAAAPAAPARAVTPQSLEDPFAPAAAATQQQQLQPDQAEGRPLAATAPKKSAADILRMFDAPQASLWSLC